MLRIENLNKSFDDFQLKNINFNLEEGFIMGLIGPNGSGKTTLIKLIMDLLQSDSGEIYFKNENIKNNTKNFKENLGFVYDDLYFYENLKVKDFKKIIGNFYTNFDKEKFDNYLDKFNINKNYKIKILSKGQKIKLMLAKSLSHSAKLLIFDEPTSGLDPIFRKEMIRILQEELEGGDKSAIFSTHITQDLEQAADYITFINNGELVFSESKEVINESYKIAKGKKEELDNMGIDFIKRNDTPYYSEGLFTKSGYNLNYDNVRVATLEEIIYYLGRGDA
ncbi:ABC transporter ATP-binding protein [Romboutsia sp.]|uniref:ABC transporter ATP-binding protein n=1 Tax=Romboutsia sp. TaxID=1965302 RepID=UPI003F32808D